jgi:hypothetical protein
MINCKSINSEILCIQCSRGNNQYCWISYYKTLINATNFEKQNLIELFNSFIRNYGNNETELDNERIVLFSLTIETFFPQYIPLFNTVTLLK